MKARDYWMELVLLGVVVSFAALEIYFEVRREQRRVEWRTHCISSGGHLVGTDSYAICVLSFSPTE